MFDLDSAEMEFPCPKADSPPQERLKGNREGHERNFRLAYDCPLSRLACVRVERTSSSPRCLSVVICIFFYVGSAEIRKGNQCCFGATNRANSPLISSRRKRIRCLSPSAANPF